jgi:hypothetical protein
MTIDEARDFIESAEIIKEYQVIPGHFRPCLTSPYRTGYDWLYRFEQDVAKFLGPKLKFHPSDLTGEKSLLHQALSNAFDHAHHRNRLKPITVRILLGSKGFIIQVTDCGRGFNLQRMYKHCRKNRRYLSSVGDGLRLMAANHRYGVFYNRKGTSFHLLFLYEENLDEQLSNHLAVVPKTRQEPAHAH